MQVLSGLLLVVYYQPGGDANHASVLRINSQIEFGWMIRSVHSWSANLMLLAAFLHMFSVFFMKDWWSGIGLLGLGMGFGFSGCLLPWDQLAHFATKIGMEVMEKAPFVGKGLATLLREGPDVGPATVQRFYALHAAVLPVLFVPLLLLHLFLVQRHGNATPPSVKTDGSRSPAELRPPLLQLLTRARGRAPAAAPLSRSGAADPPPLRGPMQWEGILVVVALLDVRDHLLLEARTTDGRKPARGASPVEAFGARGRGEQRVADPGRSDSPVRVLVLNFGSSSLKYELFDVCDLTALASGVVERIGPQAELVLRARSGREEVRRPIRAIDPSAALAAAMEALRNSGFLRRPEELAATGHRVVHGGASFEAPVRVDERVLEAIRATCPLAPLHNPASLTGIEVALALLPGVPQVAVFDTAFHRTLPPRAYLYALPRDLARAHGVRRYGFHGTSHRYVAERAAALLGRPLEAANIVTLHLGNGASAAAIEGGRSVDTSMGMTPLEGLVMGTRSGDLDASVPLFLQRQAGLSPEALEEILERQSGLRGLCGASDMREVLSREAAGDESARLAVDLYCYRAKKYIGAYLAVLGRADALVFTAGVGEHSPEIRRRICAGLEPFGIALDGARNAAGGPPEREIQAAGARIKVLVIATHEEREIARAALEVARREAGGGPRAGPS